MPWNTFPFNNKGDELLQLLAQGSCKLRKLQLVGCATSVKGMKCLAKMSTLSDLGLGSVRITRAGMAHLSNASFQLQSLISCHSGTVKSLTPLLQRQTSLRRLALVVRRGNPESDALFLKGILPHLEKCSINNHCDSKDWFFEFLHLVPSFLASCFCYD